MGWVSRCGSEGERVRGEFFDQLEGASERRIFDRFDAVLKRDE
jgi:hypothetical protein